MSTTTSFLSPSEAQPVQPVANAEPVARLQNLPIATQEILKLAACMGSSFDLETIATVAEQSQCEVTTALQIALQEGIILTEGDEYQFLDHHLRDAAYSLISEDKKQQTHLKISQLLLRRDLPEASGAKISHHLTTAVNLSDRLQEQTRLLAFRSAIDSALVQNAPLQETLQQCTEIIVQHLGVAFARIWTTNAAGNLLELKASAGLYTHLDGDHRVVPVGSFKIGLIAQECRPHLTNNVLTDARVADKAWAKREGLVAFAGYPLFVDSDQVLGVIALFSRQPLPPTVLDALGIMAYQVSLGICRRRVAIALQESESRLRQKSQALEQALEAVNHAQLQIVQSEKMSALGNLVAGVAHEINNPVGCVVGNINVIRDYMCDLFHVIDLYQQKYPQPGAEIEAELTAIDLDYLREDLPNLVKSMKDGGDRIKSISQSLRTFSRADADTKQLFNLHEGIDSTVLILRHRLKANEKRSAVEVITNYGDLPLVNCFPGQLNQVFMNILANAIDALDECAETLSPDQNKTRSYQITIQTFTEGNQIKISIADNGVGMSEEVKSQIFNYLYTTKKIGTGTGIGMAIVQQIIDEKHGGAIEVNSELGKGAEFVICIPI